MSHEVRNDIIWITCGRAVHPGDFERWFAAFKRDAAYARGLPRVYVMHPDQGGVAVKDYLEIAETLARLGDTTPPPRTAYVSADPGMANYFKIAFEVLPTTPGFPKVPDIARRLFRTKEEAEHWLRS